ncbi:MAG: metallophosphoesterase [Hyphomonadaceae bacterium]|nr:metallophosphoesterase [Hyphomonadaceae bacterium]
MLHPYTPQTSAPARGEGAPLIALLLLFLAALTSPAFAQSSWSNVARVVVIGDLHGDYPKFEDMIRSAGLVDARGDWVGGQTHLVQLGDVPDRGPDTRRILDHLMRLERQAEHAGGRVHALIGNHEGMMMLGDLRYTVAGEFAAFADRRSANRRDAYYRRVVQYLRAQKSKEPPPAFDAAYRAQFDAAHPLGWVELRAAWSKSGAYGRFTLSHNAVIRIDDTLYLHGGIGPAYAASDPDTINRGVRAALEAENEADPVLSEAGPLWYRGLAMNEEAAETPNLQAVLAHYGVSRIVVGHTKRAPTILPRFGGRVILTDVLVPSGAADPHAYLVKEGAALFTVHRGTRVPLTGDTCAYLGAIAALDPQPSPVAPLRSGCPGAPPSPAPAAAPGETDRPR